MSFCKKFSFAMNRKAHSLTISLCSCTEKQECAYIAVSTENFYRRKNTYKKQVKCTILCIYKYCFSALLNILFHYSYTCY